MTPAPAGPGVLVLDNDDSFVHILCDYLVRLGATPRLVRSRAVSPDRLPALLTAADGLLVSPGPGGPHDAGSSVPAIRLAAAAGTPVLGVCLGHQAIAVAFGGTVGTAPEMMHGSASPVHHDGTGIYRGLPSPFPAGRYHSLAVDEATLPEELLVTARSDSGVVMGLRHRALPIDGVQFHPESVLTEDGLRLLSQWLETISPRSR